MKELLAGVTAACQHLASDGGEAAAEAIMTTDSRPKSVALEASGFRIGGMAKGAGMLAPALATMIVVITTDADLGQIDAASALATATERTFDRIDSDVRGNGFDLGLDHLRRNLFDRQDPDRVLGSYRGDRGRTVDPAGCKRLQVGLDPGPAP